MPEPAPNPARYRRRSGWALAGAVLQWAVCAAAAGTAVLGLIISDLFASLIGSDGQRTGLEGIRRDALLLLCAAVLAAALVAVAFAASARSGVLAAVCQVPPLGAALVLVVAGWFGAVSVVGLIGVTGALVVLWRTVTPRAGSETVRSDP